MKHSFPTNFKYLIVSHIPFSRDAAGRIYTDGLWARDLEQLIAQVGPVRIAAPDQTGKTLETWGTAAVPLPKDFQATFVSLPPMRSSRDVFNALRIRSILSSEVQTADLVHSSHYFHPYTVLYHAHHEAVRLGKKTLFVIAEDFDDVQSWEWVRRATNKVSFWRRQWALNTLIRRAKKCAQTASLTFLHTPAAVERYRLHAKNAIAIRQPVHSLTDVIDKQVLRKKCRVIAEGLPLRLVTACRHVPLKGLDFLIRAIHLLRTRGVDTEAYLYGDGNQTEDLKKLVDILGLQDRVFFPGALPAGPAVYREIQRSHVFVMSNRTTDFGRAFFDAMAGGTPVIAFRTAASIDTVRHGIDGLLTPLDDVESLAATIHQLHDDRLLLVKLSDGARTRAIENTREVWFDLRTQWIRELFVDDPRFHIEDHQENQPAHAIEA